MILKTGTNIERNDYFGRIDELLAPLGVRVYRTIDESGLGMFLTLDTDIFKKKTTRNAGPKHKTLYVDSVFEEFTVDDIKKMIKEYGGKKTAELLHVSRATLYRRLKEASDMNSNYIL